MASTGKYEIYEIPWLDGYYADSNGEIWSTRSGTLRKLTPCVNSNGYYYVMVSRKCVRRNYMVSRLVALVFHGEPPSSKHVVMHKDNCITNNVPSNLKYGTCLQNSRQMVEEGREAHQKGEESGRSKLTTSQVLEIRERCCKGELQKVIARDYGVQQSQVSRIWTEKTWSHI